jgi:serine/threonine protein kinase
VVELLQSSNLIFGRFRVDGPMAGGGQSFGFRGQDLLAPVDKPWQRTVFIKQYHDLIPGTPEALALRSHFEALNNRLKEESGYLCLPLHIDEVNNSITAVFPFVQGKSLQQLMDEGLSQDQCVRFAQAITNAIRILHKAGIAHLDLKPANILIEENRKTGKLFVRLIDTDGAQIDGVGLRTKVIGTYSYMSPEHFAPQQYGPVSRSSDVFTLGILLFQLLLKEHPFCDGEYRELAESESFDIPANQYHREVIEHIVNSLRAYPTMRPQAGWVHSTLHKHHASNLERIGAADLWHPPRVRITSRGFSRTYYRGIHLGRNHFRGSVLTSLPSTFLRLRLDRSGPLIELTDTTVETEVAGARLWRSELKRLRSLEVVTIRGTDFEFVFHP